MATTNFPNGFRDGVTIKGIPVVGEISNKAYWVHSGTGSDGNSGKTPEKAFATIDYAVGKCASARGDIIYVMPGHSETITAAAGIDADVAGISIIGLGIGDGRPTITFTTVAGADIDIDAANIRISNMRFLCNIASQTAMIDNNSDGAVIDNCFFSEGTATGLAFIDVNGGAANACDRTKICNNEFYIPTAGNGAEAVELGEVADFVEVSGNTIIGDFDNAGIHNPTGKILTHLVIANNIIHNLQTGQHAIELVSACTGACIDNRLYSDAYATTLDPGSLKCSGNIASNGIDAGGVMIPVTADVADNYIGTDDADNAATTTNIVANEDGSILERLEQVQEVVNKGTGTAIAANKSLVDAVGSDGSVLTYGVGSALGAIGTVFWVTKTLISSTVTQAGVDITGVSSIGALAVEDIVVKTDATGLAAGTNFKIDSDNAKGLASIFAETVANLGVSKTMDLSQASVTKIRSVLETGKKLIAKSTVADCTGAGTIDVNIKFRRLVAGATIAAA